MVGGAACASSPTTPPAVERTDRPYPARERADVMLEERGRVPWLQNLTPGTLSPASAPASILRSGLLNGAAPTHGRRLQHISAIRRSTGSRASGYEDRGVLAAAAFCFVDLALYIWKLWARHRDRARITRGADAAHLPTGSRWCRSAATFHAIIRKAEDWLHNHFPTNRSDRLTEMALTPRTFLRPLQSATAKPPRLLQRLRTTRRRDALRTA